HSRNKGVRAAAGRYIAFLDADDIWLPEKLEVEIAFMKERNVGFVFTGYEFGDEYGNPTGKVVRVPEQLEYKQALSRTVIFTSTVLIDTRIIDKSLIRMPHVESEDSATWWQILKAGYVAYGLDQVLAIYRRPDKSLSSNKVRACKRIWNLYRKVEKLSVLESSYYFIGWAYRATMRRV
ncbi:MAG: glycosyltransferase, partial [Eubacteriales bacterium]